MPFPRSGYYNNLDYMGANNNLYGNCANPMAGIPNPNNAVLSNLLFNSKMNYYDNILQNNDLSQFYTFDFSNPYNFNQSVNNNNISANPYNPDLFNPIQPNIVQSNSISTPSNIWSGILNMLAIKKAQITGQTNSLEENSESRERDNIEISNGNNQDLVDIAYSQLGKKESDGSFHKFTKGHDVKWCAAFVAWCLKQNGNHVKGESGNTNWNCDILAKNILAENPDAVVFDRKKGLTDTSEIKPGSIIFFSRNHSSKDYTHVGVVEKVKNGKIYTIEGNTKDKVGRNVYDSDSKYVQTILNV